MGRIREVRKRDNRIVPFDSTKIADAIYAAFRSMGEGDRALAVELSSAVTHFLEEKFQGSIPGIEDIQDVVETVLIEMGHTRVAKAYILYRQKRAMLRETVQVRKERSPGVEAPAGGDGGDEWGSDDSAYPEVDQGADGVSLWQKSKVAAALIREADLDPGVAEDIASNVERKVLNSGLHRISTSLIRELVDNELFERGFSAKLQKQAPIGVPKYNLEQIIFGTDTKEGYAFPKTPLEIRSIIANRVLHQYSLQEVFTPGVADAHVDGRIFIHRLSDPIRLSRLRWSLPLPGGTSGGYPTVPNAPASYLDLGDFFRRLWHLAHFFSEECRLCELPHLLLDPGSRSLSTAEKIRAILERLSQMDSRPDIALEFDLVPEALPWLQGLRDMSVHRPKRFLLSLRLRSELFQGLEGEQVLRALAELYEMGERIEFLPGWSSGLGGSLQEGAQGLEDSSRSARSGPRLRANAAKITINLPRAAFRSARDRRNSVESEIDEVLDIAIKGHLERRRFIERLGANRENPLWDLLGKGSAALALSMEDLEFGIGLVGLNECVKFLTGNDLHQDRVAARMGIDIVKEIHRKLRREARSLGIRLVLEETANVGPLRTLERTDRRKYLQMAEIDRGRSPSWGSAYTHGVRLHRMAPLDPFRRVEDLAAYLRLLEPAGGFVEDFPELRTSAGELLLSLLEECVSVVCPSGGEVVPGGAAVGRGGAGRGGDGGREGKEEKR